ncbi:hypothetical protein SLE2022_310140 [Rubroshorea leprosula]
MCAQPSRVAVSVQSRRGHCKSRCATQGEVDCGCFHRTCVKVVVVSLVSAQPKAGCYEPRPCAQPDIVVASEQLLKPSCATQGEVDSGFMCCGHFHNGPACERVS